MTNQARALRVWCIAVVGLGLVACNPAPSVAAAPIVGQGFRLSLPSGWTAGAPKTVNGYTTYALQPHSGGLDVTVATLPIPNDSADPTVATAMHGDIAILALMINGTTGAHPQLTEQAHGVTFVGEHCARMGLAIGSGGESRSITCRRDRVIYVVSVSSLLPTSQLIPTLDTVAAAWSWT